MCSCVTFSGVLCIVLFHCGICVMCTCLSLCSFVSPCVKCVVKLCVTVFNVLCADGVSLFQVYYVSYVLWVVVECSVCYL